MKPQVCLLYFGYILVTVHSICNLNGRVIKAITVEEAPHVMVDQSCLKSLEEETKRLPIKATDCVHGLIKDILKEVSNTCNFTLELYLRKGAFGNVKLINDTLVTTGNFQGFETPYQEGDYDLIANPVVMKDLRLRIVDYTVPYMDTKMVIVIKNDLRQENHWLMYMSIMSPEVWFLMIITLIFPCLILSLEELLIQNGEVTFKSLICNLYSAFTINFGGNFLTKNSQRTVPKITIFLCHFCYGIVIWIYFRAILTSRLTERHHDLPFETLKELSNTDYFLYTGTGYSSTLFTEAKQNQDSDYFNVVTQNMDNGSFIDSIQSAMEKLSEETRTSFYYYKFDVDYYIYKGNKSCNFLIPWKSDVIKYNSIAFRKEFPYFKEINGVLKKMRESGQIQRKLQRYTSNKVHDCDEDITIGYDQVLPLFVVLFVSGSVGLAYMIFFEVPWKRFGHLEKSNKNII